MDRCCARKAAPELVGRPVRLGETPGPARPELSQQPRLSSPRGQAATRRALPAPDCCVSASTPGRVYHRMDRDESGLRQPSPWYLPVAGAAAALLKPALDRLVDDLVELSLEHLLGFLEGGSELVETVGTVV